MSTPTPQIDPVAPVDRKFYLMLGQVYNQNNDYGNLYAQNCWSGQLRTDF